MGASATPAERPRVLHVAQAFAGGIASYLEELADYQKEQFGRSNVAFVVPAHAPRFARLDPAQLICFKSASRRPAALVDFARQADAAIARFKPNVVHLHSSFAGAIVRSLLAMRSARPHIVYCPHGWAFGMDISPAKKAGYAFLERRLARATDTILVNSRSEFELGAQFGLPLDKMRVVANGIGSAPPLQRPVRSGPLRIAFIGRHDRQKGLDILLDAVRRFPLSHIQFDIVGDRILAPAGRGSAVAGDNITCHGWLKRSEITALLANVDAVVMPSRWEAFGLVAIEAMRAGVPVIASDRGALPEVVENGATGFIFKLDDPDALGVLLGSLTRQQLADLGPAARKRWETQFMADRMNALIGDTYAHVLTQAHCGRTAAAPIGDRGALAPGAQG
ncbi:glycosyltransferase [Sphingomonas sp.]|uniref:glycosyltransferase n=1 Tax=Sphingomonas sp. TaxID=28214 RepID=UPI00286E263A|nr:glycosyltransferase [Sphingomonas sp.]